MKYLGYRMGKRYQKLPEGMVMKCTMNRHTGRRREKTHHDDNDIENCVSFGIAGDIFLMMRKIRQSKLQIESAIFWIVLSIVLVVFSIFPSVADFASRLLGIYATTNFLFLFAIFLLIVKVFYMTIHISQLETRVKELVQQMALEEKWREEQSQMQERESRSAAEKDAYQYKKECREGVQYSESVQPEWGDGADETEM